MDLVLLCVLGISIYTDIRFQKIYNWVIAPATLVALTCHFYFGGFPELWHGIKGFLLGMGLLIIPYSLGGMGAGDVKLLGFVGAYGGPGFVWETFLATAIIGGIMSLAILIKNRRLKSGLKTTWHTFLSLLGLVPRVNMNGTIQGEKAITLPYGVAITTGTMVAYLVR